MKRESLVAWLVLGTCCPSCGDGVIFPRLRTESSSGVSETDLTKLRQGLADAVCTKLMECCTAEERADGPIAHGDFEACVSHYDAAYSFMVGGVRHAVVDGRATFDSDQAELCVRSFQERSCEELRVNSQTTGNCDFLTPLVATGGECQEQGECIGGFCDEPVGAEIGVCVAHAALGEPCDRDLACASDSCRYDNLCQEKAPTPFCGD